jgi:hypothetical protein
MPLWATSRGCRLVPQNRACQTGAEGEAVVQLPSSAERGAEWELWWARVPRPLQNAHKPEDDYDDDDRQNETDDTAHNRSLLDLSEITLNDVVTGGRRPGYGRLGGA